MDRDDEERSQQMIEDQIVRAMAAKKVRKRERERDILTLFTMQCKGDDDEEPQYTELKRKDENEKSKTVK